MSGPAFLPVGPCSLFASSVPVRLRNGLCGGRGPVAGGIYGSNDGIIPRQRAARGARLRACLPQEENSGFALADLPVVPLVNAPDRPGAYAVRDSDGKLAYLGYSRSVSSMIRFHEGRVGSGRAATCQYYAPEDRPVGPDLLEAVLEYWVRENGGVVPAGNLADRTLWEGTGREAAPGSPQAQEERQKVLTRMIFAFFAFSSVVKFVQYTFFPY
jgi:hypothetical protein